MHGISKKINSRKMDKISTIATQTTLPKTRRTRTFVWENKNEIPFKLHILPRTQYNYGSFPYTEAFHFSKYPLPRIQKSELPLVSKTLPCALDRYKDVRRENLGETSSFGIVKKNNAEKNPADFSDDSLDEPVLSFTKRENLAWELGCDDDAYFTPGSTKVIGRRRKKSVEHSSSNSIHRLGKVEVWFENIQSAQDQNISLYNDAEEIMLSEALPLDLTFNGTYVIRKGKKEKIFKKNSTFEKPSEVLQELDLSPHPDFKRCRSTFDSIKSLLKENNVAGMKDRSTQFLAQSAPTLMRVVSLPNLSLEEADIVGKVDIKSKCNHAWEMKESLTQEVKNELSSLHNLGLNFTLTYCESAENKKFNCIRIGKNNRAFEIENLKKQVKKCNEVETQTDLSDVEKQNELESFERNPEVSKPKSELEEVEKKIQEIVKIKTVSEQEGRKEFANPWIKEEIFDEKSPHKYHVNVKILQNDFGPLPPSPVDKHKEEYSNMFEVASAQSLSDKTDQFYQCQNPSISDPIGKCLNRKLEPLPHRTSDPISSVSRFLDVGLKKGFREYSSELRKEKTNERLTLPSEFQDPALRCQTLQKSP